MKNNVLFSALILALAFTTFSFTNPTEDVKTLKIDAASSSLNWAGHKIGGTHSGTINIKSGDLQFKGDKLVGGEFVIDMTTITDTDMEGGYAKKLEGHLKSDDFFGVEAHPTATFKITKVGGGKDGNYTVAGDLTIKGITNAITFDALVSEEGMNFVSTAKFKVDRSKFNVKYGSSSFFDNLKDKAIDDEFDMEVKLVTAK